MRLGLGFCGAIMQSLLRNPLADPFVLGISSGASTGAVIVGVLGISGAVLGLSGGAFIGALVAFGLVLLLARLAGGRQRQSDPRRGCQHPVVPPLTSFVIFAFTDSDETRGVMFWLLGSLEGVRWNDVALCVTVVGAGAMIYFDYAFVLDAFAFGNGVASSLGMKVKKVQMALLMVTALITATLVSVSVAIGFVGLVLPHAARFLVGSHHSRLIPATAIIGAIFMVRVDAVSRAALAPTPLCVGVGTALVGVPAFIVIMARRRISR